MISQALHRQLKPENLQIKLRCTPRQELGLGDYTLTWGLCSSPYGRCLAGFTESGLCGLDLVPDEDALERLRRHWCIDLVRRDDRRSEEAVIRFFSGENPALHIGGTEFQLRVWRAVLGIRSGCYMTYADIAAVIGSPGAARAVGSAVGANCLAVAVPCHRVLPASGLAGNYRWGRERKLSLLNQEAGRGAVERRAVA